MLAPGSNDTVKPDLLNPMASKTDAARAAFVVDRVFTGEDAAP